MELGTRVQSREYFSHLFPGTSLGWMGLFLCRRLPTSPPSQFLVLGSLDYSVQRHRAITLGYLREYPKKYKFHHKKFPLELLQPSISAVHFSSVTMKCAYSSFLPHSHTSSCINFFLESNDTFSLLCLSVVRRLVVGKTE